MSNMLSDILQQYGFSEKEANVYLAALECGIAPASSISRRIGENRVTVYSILKTLKKRGIVYETQKKGTTWYGVIEPHYLLDQQKQKVTQLEEKLPEFAALMHMGGSKPKVQYFEGVEGLKQLYADTLYYENTEIRAFLSTNEIDKDIQVYLNNIYVPERVRKNISARVVAPVSIKNEVYAHQDDVFLRKTKILTHPLFSFATEINMYGDNKVAFILFTEGEMSGLVVTSKGLHQTCNSIFELLWSI